MYSGDSVQGPKARVNGALGSLGIAVTLWLAAMESCAGAGYARPTRGSGAGLLPLLAITAVAMFLARRRR